MLLHYNLLFLLYFFVTLFKHSILILASDIIKNMLQYFLDSVESQHSAQGLHDVPH